MRETTIKGRFAENNLHPARLHPAPGVVWFIGNGALGISRFPNLRPTQKRRGEKKGAGVMPAPCCLYQSASGMSKVMAGCGSSEQPPRIRSRAGHGKAVRQSGRHRRHEAGTGGTTAVR
jgi:hypothetical protein